MIMLVKGEEKIRKPTLRIFCFHIICAMFVTPCMDISPYKCDITKTPRCSLRRNLARGNVERYSEVKLSPASPLCESVAEHGPSDGYRLNY
jgi:hypothetical protein